MKGKRFLYKFLYRFIAPLVALIVVGGWITLEKPSLLPNQPHQLYDYSDYSASLPAKVQSGESIHIDWRGYPDPVLYAYTKPRAYATVPMTLSVLAIPQAIFHQQWTFCGKRTQAMMLDVIRTDNRTGASWYTRVITSPHTLHPGSYELVRIASSPVRSACFSKTIFIVA